MKTAEAEQWLRQELRALYDERESANIAALVMESVTGRSRIDRVARRDEPLLVQQLHHLTELHHRLLQHQPVQYVLGEAWFRGLRLFVDHHVLIPRPETEELVEWIINDLKDREQDVFERGPFEADETSRLKILDVGTGSGCIALALKKEMPKAEVWGCDISDGALTVARRNGAELDIRVDFVGLNFLDEEQVRQLPTVDILVSNPPYIPERERASMSRNVVGQEPDEALFVPDKDPLLFYRALARFGHQRLYPYGTLYAEVHADHGADVARLFEAEGYSVSALRRDLQGRERMIKVENVSR